MQRLSILFGNGLALSPSSIKLRLPGLIRAAWHFPETDRETGEISGINSMFFESKNSPDLILPVTGRKLSYQD